MSTAYRLKRAPFRGALFFIGLLLLSACVNGADSGSLARVEKVIDGDTIILRNDDIVRFLGINAPELGGGKFPDQPLANQAKRYVAGKIEGREVSLENERDKQDKYGRRLAHIFTRQGENIQTGLLERGLAFVVAVGEGDFDYIELYSAAEDRARQAGKGVWASEFYAPIFAKTAINSRQRGYQRVRGKVLRISESRNNQSLHLDNDFRILVAHPNWKKYFKGSAQRYVGKSVEVRGWVFNSHGVTGMKIYHPAMLVPL